MKESVYDYSYEMKQNRERKFLKGFLLCIGVILFISLIINYLLFPVFVASDSMAPDIEKNNSVFVTPIKNDLKRGNVVLIDSHSNSFLPWYKNAARAFIRFFTLQQFNPFNYNKRMTGRDSIRRLVALPGDTIYMKDYILYVQTPTDNSVLTEFELTSKSYNLKLYSLPENWNNLGCIASMEERTLGEDEYFVLADNRIEAIDSRVYGPISFANIKGKVILDYFPFNKFRIF